MRKWQSIWVTGAVSLALLLGACRQAQAPADTTQAPAPATADATSATTAPTATPGADPLPSWRDGKNKQDILAFVKAATTEGGPGFIPPEARVATFDNDGTLWAEQPIVQLQFVLQRVAELAKQKPELAKDPAVKAVLDQNLDFFRDKDGEKHLMKLLALTSTGLSPADFEAAVKAFFAEAKHPKLNVPYKQTTYKPMVELLQYLRANGFQTWILSGGGIDFMRPIAESFYGIPPQQVIGSTGEYDVKLQDGKLAINKAAKVALINDHEGKVAGILTHIGKVPVFAAGNERSAGDIAQLTYSQTSPYPSFQLMVNHDDGEREFAYDEKDGASLAAAKANNWHVVSIRDDWVEVYAGP
ncbi:haloacid dehalogenase-like hydrolase [Luteimonas cucumeris]|uniref:Haloacid dehalogenase-like hydrolase n=1 Tax=Luteimonas cucumeris TaxID=985012 RepID=A0A562LBA9_9GAMM|nr:HAD family hydrolase [Luteimonas cucumeris]TWI04962.1 haloacid dehalogenase-like hydrolase [Luteimonas cucumeris]